MDFHVITSAGVFHILSTGSAPSPGPSEHAQGDIDRHTPSVQIVGSTADAVLERQDDGAVHGG